MRDDTNNFEFFKIKSARDLGKWSKSDKKTNFTENFKEILNFYLLECPAIKNEPKKVKDKTNYVRWRSSFKGKQFNEYGFEKNKLGKLLNYFKGTILIQFIKNIEEAETKSEEFICAMENSNMSKTSTIFYHIRNAFAHGSFVVNDGVYMFVFYNPAKNKIKGYCKIKEETLLNWIKVIKSGKVPENKNH